MICIISKENRKEMAKNNMKERRVEYIMYNTLNYSVQRDSFILQKRGMWCKAHIYVVHTRCGNLVTRLIHRMTSLSSTVLKPCLTVQFTLSVD